MRVGKVGKVVEAASRWGRRTTKIAAATAARWRVGKWVDKIVIITTTTTTTTPHRVGGIQLQTQPLPCFSPVLEARVVVFWVIPLLLILEEAQLQRVAQKGKR